MWVCVCVFLFVCFCCVARPLHAAAVLACATVWTNPKYPLPSAVAVVEDFDERSRAARGEQKLPLNGHAAQFREAIFTTVTQKGSAFPRGTKSRRGTVQSAGWALLELVPRCLQRIIRNHSWREGDASPSAWDHISQSCGKQEQHSHTADRLMLRERNPRPNRQQAPRGINTM